MSFWSKVWWLGRWLAGRREVKAVARELISGATEKVAGRVAIALDNAPLDRKLATDLARAVVRSGEIERRRVVNRRR